MFREQLLRGVPLTITDPRMTRFWWTVEQAAQFVLECRSRMIGGEVFLPKIYSSKMGDLAGVTSALLGIGEPKINVVGVRPGEKMHEVLMAPDEVSRTHDLGWCYAVYPSLKFFDMDNRVENLVDSYFVYSSSDTLMRADVLEALVGRALGKEKP
jgi:UDP-N-acetylglucosamine 4,6-dehydratase